MKRIIIILLGILVLCGAAAAQDLTLINDDPDEQVIMRDETLIHEEIPTPPVPVEPTGTKNSRAIGFYWTPSERADSYEVTWKDESGNEGKLTLGADDPSCQNGQCIVYGYMPAAGNYHWSVSAVNGSGSIGSEELSFTAGAAGAALQAYRPNTAISNLNVLTFEWQDTRSDAAEFRIQVQEKDSGRIRLDRRYQASDLFTGNGVCLVNTDVFLPAGDYLWRVTAMNGDSAAGWSDWVGFTIKCEFCSTEGAYYNGYASTVTTPSYPISDITESAPAFEWRTLTGASAYLLTISDGAGSQLLQERLEPSGICDPELCRYEPGLAFDPGETYTWTVNALSAAGANWGSGNASFTVREDEIPAAVMFVLPSEDGKSLDAVSPRVIWTDPGEAAAGFAISISDREGTPLLQADLNREQCWCDGITCSIEFDSLPDDTDYRISISALSAVGSAGETVSRSFSKGAPKLKLSAPAAGAAVQSRMLFRWFPDAGEDVPYELVLTDANGSETRYMDLYCGMNGLSCDRGEAFYIPETGLPAGAYTLLLTTADGSAQSDSMQFTVR